MKKIILLFAIFSIAFIIKSQSIKFASSNNSKFFVTLKYEGKKEKEVEIYKRGKPKTGKIKLDGYKLDVYKISTREWLRSVEFMLNLKSEPDKIGISNNGLVCYVEEGRYARFWNIVTGKLILETEMDSCYFPKKANYFIITNHNYVRIKDIFSGKTINSFKIAGVKSIKNIKLSTNGNYLVAKSARGRIAFMNIKADKKAKTVRGNQFLIDDNKKIISVLLAQSNTLNIERYSLDTKKKLYKFNAANFIRKLNTDARKKLGKTASNSFKLFKLHTDKCKLLANNKSIGLYLTKEISKDSLQEFLYIVDIGNKKTTNIIDDTKFKDDLKLAEFAVYNASSLIIPLAEHLDGIYEIDQKQFSTVLWYLFDRKIDNDRYSIKKQIKKRHISPNYKYVIIESNNYKNPIIYAKLTTVRQAYSKIENALFLGYSANSKYIFVQGSNNRLAYIETFDISAGISDTPPVQFFSETITYAAPEDLIDEDGNAPDDYNYVKITGFKHISELDPKTNIHLHFKTMALGETQSGIQLHLIDKDGIYYYGASEKEWLFIWRKLLVQFSEDSSIKHVKNFKVTEYFGNDSIANSMVLVLDHSGSMGNERAVSIQKAAVGFIEKKGKDDKVAIVKYDDKIGLDADLTKDSKKLIKSIEVKGLKGYGGGTSILDAVAYGASVLKENGGNVKKSVVILTDGNENSSYLNKGEVLKYANLNGIKINTIGFGSFVSEDYLKALSYYTQGSYYQIYNTLDFDWIFDDIYKKMNHYYSISFETEKIGEYKAVLEIALDSVRRDTLITVFNTEKIDYDSLAVDIDSLPFMPPVVEFNVEDADIAEIIEFSDSIEENIPIIKPEIVEEFNEIEFPDIKFVSKGTHIANGTEKGIENVVAFLNKYKKINIEILGHTDNIGSEANNLKLSIQRTKKVKELLLEKGINENRIKTVGYGEEKPIEDNSTEEGRQKNRRVEFKIINSLKN